MSLITKGTFVNLNNITNVNPALNNYVAGAWEKLKSLGVNCIRVGGGSEGDYYIRLHINNYPNEWANKLEALLTVAHNNGIQLCFPQLGNYWHTDFGIECPEPSGGFAGTPLDEAKVMIDKLAGNNSLGKNFLADPRVWAWSPSNEVDLADPTTRDWTIQMLDYMRSKGAKVFASSPRNTGYSSAWIDSSSFQATEPILRGHVDFLSFHDYRLYETVLAKNRGDDIYQFVLDQFKSDLQNYVLNALTSRDSMALDNVMLDEFGMWSGYDNGAGIGLPATFTDEDKGKYYQGVYDACAAMGIKRIFNFYCFPQVGTDQRKYEIVNLDGTELSQATKVLRQYYAPAAPVTQSGAGVGIIAVLAVLGIALLLLVSRRR